MAVAKTGSHARLEISEEFFSELDKELAGLEIIQRMPAVKAGMRKAGNIVAQRYRENIPRPEKRTGAKAGKKHLADTVAVKVSDYPSGKVLAVVGAQYPAGAHGHLVEEGHRQVVGGKASTGKTVTGPESVVKAMGKTGRVVGHVEGRHYLQKAVDATKGQVEEAFRETVIAAIEQAKKGQSGT